MDVNFTGEIPRENRYVTNMFGKVAQWFVYSPFAADRSQKAYLLRKSSLKQANI